MTEPSNHSLTGSPTLDSILTSGKFGPKPDALPASELRCCGLPVSEDGFCQHRPSHQRQVTLELLDKATLAAAKTTNLRAAIRAALEVTL